MKGLVVALLAITAAGVGYLAYSELQKNDAVDQAAIRIVQSRVADGIRAAIEPRAAVEQYFEKHSEFPRTLASAGYSSLSTRLPDHVKGISAGPDGQIVISYRTGALNLPTDIRVATLSMIPELTDGGEIRWSCVASMPFGKHREIIPTACLR